MEVSRGINFMAPQLLIFLSNNRELLEMKFFSSSYLFGELVNKKFWEKILETVGDARNPTTF